ncbi:MAG TPA: hypothetical protein VGB04_04530 [Allosphingosinicella sp.]|jgi:hypothetical protein
MEMEDGDASNQVSPRKNRRKRKVLSAGGERYLSQCALARKSQGELFAFIDTKYPHLFSKVDYYIRRGKNADNQVRDVLTEFLKGTQYSVSYLWFDNSWSHFSALDAFVEANSDDTGAYPRFCGEFLRIFPTTPGVPRVPEHKSEFAVRPITIGRGAGGVLRWTQPNEDDSQRPILDGFGLYDAHTVFLIGFNCSERNIISYFVLRQPVSLLRDQGVALAGLQAGTLPLGPNNGYAFAKRNVLVTPQKWEEWGAGDSCPEPVRTWLLSDEHGLRVDLVTERHDYAD